MSALGAAFFLFAVAGMVASWLFREDGQKRGVSLAVVTFVFYIYVDVLSAGVLVLIAGVVWYATRRMQTEREQHKRRSTLIASLFCTSGVLTLWRFAPALGIVNVERSWWQPLGMAVLALQAAGCLVDVYRRDCGEIRFYESVLVCGFFPRAVAGPVMRAESLLYQIRQPWSGVVPIERVGVLVVGACFKKYVLAEMLTAHSALVTASRATEGRVDIVASWMSGALQFVCDTSAYTDLVIAAGLLCGVKLPENFRAPFSGWSVGETMRRWHMSVSGFFRDYVLAPLRGNSTSNTRVFLSVVATSEAVALWHGFAPTTAVWGLLIGIPVGVETVLAKRRAERRERRKSAPTGVKRVVMAVAVFFYSAVISTFFPPDSLENAVGVLQNFVQHSNNATDLTSGAAWGAIFVAWALAAGLFAPLAKRSETVLKAVPAPVVGVLCAVAAAFLAGLAGGGVPSFLYQRL